MKFFYYPETDSLYIDLSSKKSADSRQVSEGVVIDFDSEGNIVGIDIDKASHIMDLSQLEMQSMPLTNITFHPSQLKSSKVK